MEGFTENSIDLEDTREDYKNELLMLHVRLKALNRDVDLSAILNPLLAETGPAIAHVPRLYKQIARPRSETVQADCTSNLFR